MKIGIGITTYCRPGILTQFINKLILNTDPKLQEIIDFYINDDCSPVEYGPELAFKTITWGKLNSVVLVKNKTNNGVAASNSNLFYLMRDNDIIFRFPDDITVHQGWLTNYVNTLNKIGTDFLLPYALSYKANDNAKIMDYKNINGVEIERWNRVRGPLCLTKKAINTCGGMVKAFKKWGHEHTEYTYRLYTAAKRKQITDTTKSQWGFFPDIKNSYKKYIYFDQASQNQSTVNAEERSKYDKFNSKIMNDTIDKINRGQHVFVPFEISKGAEVLKIK